jgi:hypothetical protein
MLCRGQLGLGHVMDQLQPCRLDPPAPLLSWKVELIACGYAHTVFLTHDLSVFSCGANSWGQLGLGDTDDRNRPCKVERLSKVAVRQLDCGAAHTMVVCDGSRDYAEAVAAPAVEELGAAAGVLGSDEGPDEEPDEPGPVGPGVYGFGRNKEGQLGLGPRSANMVLNDQIQRKPVLVETLSRHITEEGSDIELRCGGYHTAVLVEARTKLLTFGQNCYGQLGLGDVDDRFEPGEVDLSGCSTDSPEDRIIDILACGGGHTMVVTHGNTVLAFGRNNRGQLGVGDLDHHGEPSRVTKLCGMDIVQVECGSKHTIVLTKANELFAIGRNTEGQLGMGEVEQQPEPKAVDASAWIPRSGHLSVGGFSAHNFFVPVPRMDERRTYVAVLVREQKIAMVMALHRRIGKDSIANMLDLHILRDICSFLPMRRTGTALADGEEIGKRSPSVTTMIKELRLAPKPLPSPPSSPPPTSPRSDAGGSAADDGSPAAEEEGVE